KDAGIQNQHVQPAVSSDSSLQGARHRLLGSDVALQAQKIRRVSGTRIAIETYDCRATFSQSVHTSLPYSGRSSGNQCDLAGEHWRRAGTAEFRLFEVPVFELKQFLLREGAISAERLRPLDHVDRMRVK